MQISSFNLLNKERVMPPGFSITDYFCVDYCEAVSGVGAYSGAGSLSFFSSCSSISSAVSLSDTKSDESTIFLFYFFNFTFLLAS